MNETEKVVASVNSPVIYGSDEEHIREQVTDIQLRAESFVIETDDDYRERRLLRHQVHAYRHPPG